VQQLVGVQDLQVLPDHDPGNAGGVAAAALVDDRRFREGVRTFGEVVGDVDEDVRQARLVVDLEDLGVDGSVVLRGAGRVGVHADRAHGGNLAVEADGSGDRTAAERLGGRRLRGRGGRFTAGIRGGCSASEADGGKGSKDGEKGEGDVSAEAHDGGTIARGDAGRSPGRALSGRRR